jgi:Domain of unknown function (DUF4333)
VRLALAALVALVAAVGLSACGTKKLKDKDVADEIKSKVLAPKGITGARVKCPAESEAKKGARIRCSVSGTHGNKGRVTATVLDEDGKLGAFDSSAEDLQRAVVERNAADKAHSQGASGDVTCGKGTAPKKGATFFCTTNIKGSGTGVVLVTQKDERGNVGVVVRKKRLTTGGIERSIGAQYKKQVGINVTVKCPSKVKSQIGATFSCKVTNPANGRSQTIVATQKDTEGHFSLKVK